MEDGGEETQDGKTQEKRKTLRGRERRGLNRQAAKFYKESQNGGSEISFHAPISRFSSVSLGALGVLAVKIDLHPEFSHEALPNLAPLKHMPAPHVRAVPALAVGREQPLHAGDESGLRCLATCHHVI
jgi:hypothetical protein